MPAVGKVTVKKVKGDIVVSDESGASYTFPRHTGRPLLLDIDPRIGHILLWLESQSRIHPVTRLLIGEAGVSRRLFMSETSLWEFGVAVHKKSLERRPNLQGLSVQEWFAKTTAMFGIRQLRISPSIALEAANVPGVYGAGDPGDCFLIATARLRRLSLVRRDSKSSRWRSGSRTTWM